MKQNKESYAFPLMRCPRCKTSDIYAISIRDCYYDTCFCLHCGKVDIEITQEIETHRDLYRETKINKGTSYKFRYADGVEIKEFKEAEDNEKNANII